MLLETLLQNCKTLLNLQRHNLLLLQFVFSLAIQQLAKTAENNTTQLHYLNHKTIFILQASPSYGGSVVLERQREAV